VEFSVGFDVDADVTEITALMRHRLVRTGWPRRLRVIVRRTRLAPGEQPTLFQLDGYKYSCFVTTTATLNLQLIDARHRAHARVEDQVRTTKDTGPGHLPSKSWQVNSGWCQAVAIAADLLAWFKLLGCTGIHPPADLGDGQPLRQQCRCLSASFDVIHCRGIACLYDILE
jgi:hypothetical protein